MISLSTAIRPALPPPSCGTCWQDMVMINPPSSSSSDGPCADLPVRGCRALRAGSKLTSAPISRAQALVYQKTRPCSAMREARVTGRLPKSLELQPQSSGPVHSAFLVRLLRGSCPSVPPTQQSTRSSLVASSSPPLFLPDPSYCSCLRVILLVRKVLAFS